jgi:Oligosaccharyltransferase 48 kDa subunit beta
VRCAGWSTRIRFAGESLISLQIADNVIFSADRGYKLNYKLADDASLNIKKYGKYLFEHIVIFAPSVEELGGSLSVEALTEFVDEGGKCLILS